MTVTASPLICSCVDTCRISSLMFMQLNDLGADIRHKTKGLNMQPWQKIRDSYHLLIIGG